MKRTVVAIIFISSLIFSCSSPQNRDQVNVNLPQSEEVREEDHFPGVSFSRFDQDFSSISKETFSEDTTRLIQKYGSFLDLYTNKIVRLGSRNHPIYRENILGFLNDPDIKEVNEAIQKEYSGITDFTGPVTKGFRRFYELFPDTVIPKILTINSGFNYNIIVADSAVAISLEMYMGENFKFYEWLRLPKYKTARMHRESIPSDLFRGFFASTFSADEGRDDLITEMIHQGKLIYLTEYVLEGIPSHLHFGYSADQLKWANINESKIWSHFVDRKLFYSTDLDAKVAYINDAPFTKGFPKEAPPKIGTWLGYQIVKSYMKKKGESIPALIYQSDAHRIFNESGYKPGRS